LREVAHYYFASNTPAEAEERYYLQLAAPAAEPVLL